MRRRGRRCGTFSAGRRCIRRQCRLRWTGSSTWPSPRDRRSLRLGCLEEGAVPGTFETEIWPKARVAVHSPELDGQPPPFLGKLSTRNTYVRKRELQFHAILGRLC